MPALKPDLFQVTSPHGKKNKLQTWSGVEATIFCPQQWRDELTDLEASVNDADQITGDVESPLQLRDGALHVAAGQGLGKVSKGQGGQEHLGVERREESRTVTAIFV